jgi:hypothetical protein
MSWFEGAGSARLEHDRGIVAEDQPALRYVVQGDGTLALIGDVTFALDSGTPQRIATRIIFPADYPQREPRAYQEPKRFPRDAEHHFYPDGRACLWLDVETRWRPTTSDALRAFLDQLTVFYLRQLMMEANPKLSFPGPWRAHGVAGHIEHLEERLRMRRRDLPRMRTALAGGVSRNAPCPCGKRIRYRKCHRDRIRLFHDRAEAGIGQLVLKELDAISESTRKATKSASSSTKEPVRG